MLELSGDESWIVDPSNEMNGAGFENLSFGVSMFC